MTFDSREQKLDELLQSYRAACPDVDGGTNFMPRLWQKIESRQTVPFRMRRFAQAIVSVTAVLCMGMSVLLFSPLMQNSALPSYVEALDSMHQPEVMAYADMDEVDSGLSTGGEITWQ
ncbi:MAG: hypothetical protein HYZ37_03145 [Candidatus Solibacter usitatus]|nr:hypothetical protein [Candidatus Solibacter usitatus]